MRTLSPFRMILLERGMGSTPCSLAELAGAGSHRDCGIGATSDPGGTMSGTPAGWYPAPHASGELRYWDGERWLESSPMATPPADLPYAARPPMTTSPPFASPTTYPQTLIPPAAPGYPGSAQPKSLAVAALAVGIGAFVTGWVPWLGLLLSIAAVTLAILALVKRQSKVMAIIGAVLGVLALATGLVMTISFMTFVSDRSTAVEGSSPSAGTIETPTAEEPTEAPEAEAPAEPAPSADGSAANPYPQPYIAVGVFGGEKYSLTARIIDANAGALVNEWNQFNTPAPTGFKYVIVEMTMTGIDPDGA